MTKQTDRIAWFETPVTGLARAAARYHKTLGIAAALTEGTGGSVIDLHARV